MGVAVVAQAPAAPKPSTPHVPKVSSQGKKISTHLKHPAWKAAKEHVDRLRRLLPPPKAKSVRPDKAGALVAVGKTQSWSLFGDKKEGKQRVAWADEVDTDEEEDPVASAMQAAASVFTNPNITYEFRFARYGQFAPTNAVAYKDYISWDVSNFTEFTSYCIFLFREVRIRHAKVTLIPLSGNIMAASALYGFSSDLGFTASAPASLQAVLDNPDSKLIDSWYYRDHEYQWNTHVPGDYLWASVSAPAADVNTGTYGQYQIAQAAVSTATDIAFGYLFEGVYEFRSRT